MTTFTHTHSLNTTIIKIFYFALGKQNCFENSLTELCFAFEITVSFLL